MTRNLVPAIGPMLGPVVEKLAAFVRAGDDNSRAQRSAALAFAIRVASAGIAFASQILLARWMGVFEYGVFTFVWILVSIASQIAGFGLNTSVLRFLPEYAETKAYGLARGFLHGGVAFILGVSTALALTGAALAQLFADIIPVYYLAPILIGVICLPMFALTEFQDGISRSQSWIDLALIPPYIIRPGLLLLFLAGAVTFGAEPSAKTALTAAVGATWLTALCQTIVLRRRLNRRAIKQRPRPEFRMGFWLKISFPILLLEGFYLLLTYADILILNLYLGPKEVGVYFAAVKTTGLIEFVYFAVTAAATHKFAEYHAAGRTETLHNFLRDTIRWTFWPSLVAACGILAAGYPLLWLFGPDFTRGYPLMFILVIGLLARASTGPAEALMNMLNQQMVCAGILFCALVINVSLNLFLIPRFGAAGAAGATAISLVFVSTALFAMAKWRLGLHTFVFGGWRSQAREVLEKPASPSGSSR